MVNAREHDPLPGVMWDWRTDLDFAVPYQLLPARRPAEAP
jgi:hypothetical protein